MPVLSEGRSGLEPLVGEDVDPVDYPVFQPRPQLITDRIIELVLLGELRSRDADCRGAGYRERCWAGAPATCVFDPPGRCHCNPLLLLDSRKCKKIAPNHFNLSIVKYDY